MGKGCCEAKSSEIDALRASQSRILKIVLMLNALMFFLEFGYGIYSKSSALLADSLDMFGDAVVYGFSLYAIGRGAVWRARAGMLKGIVMAAFAVFVFVQVIYRILQNVPPDAEAMSIIGIIALIVNALCLILLFRHRSDDINMRSTWLCSRNDILANCGVILASALVAWTKVIWPDVVVGLAISTLFLKSSFEVIFEAKRELVSFRTEVACERVGSGR